MENNYLSKKTYFNFCAVYNVMYITCSNEFCLFTSTSIFICMHGLMNRYNVLHFYSLLYHKLKCSHCLKHQILFKIKCSHKRYCLNENMSIVDQVHPSQFSYTGTTCSTSSTGTTCSTMFFWCFLEQT